MSKFIKKEQPRFPIYEALIDEDDNDDSGMRFVSIVENPAIMVKGMKFSSELGTKKEFKFSLTLNELSPNVSDNVICKDMTFKQIEEKQMLVGPMLIPDTPIYRNDEDGEYYIQFSKETIRKMVEKFNRNNNNKSINDDHTTKMVNAFFFSNWIIEDTEMDKSKFYGYDLPVGSWFGEVKVLDKNYWDKDVKGKNKYSFSIEGSLYQRLTPMKFNEIDITSEEFIRSLNEDDLKEIFSFLLKK